MEPYQWRGWQCLWMWQWSRKGFVVLWFSDSILIVVSLTPSHDFDCCVFNPDARVHWEKRRHHLSFPWHPVDYACVCAREGHPHQRKEAQLLNFYWSVFLLTLCQWRVEKWLHLSSFLDALIFDWARARRRHLL
jgi:hypothetical protein